MRIVTNSQEPGEPKDPDSANVFAIYSAFANDQQRADMHQAFADGIAWGEVKQQLFELINQELVEPRARYEALIANPTEVERVLKSGAEKARDYSQPLMQRLRNAVGIRELV